MRPIYMFGHKNPDTDTICSTIAYSEYKRLKGYHVKCSRLGELSEETKFVLKYFGVNEPEMLATVKTQVSDLEIDSPITIHPETSIKIAWTIMKNNNRKALAVSEDGRTMLGIVTLSDLTAAYMDVTDEQLLLKSKTPLSNIMETLEAKIVCGEPKNFTITGRVLVAALEHNRLKHYVKKGDIVIAGDREDSIIESMLFGANLIIATCDSALDAKVIETAKNHNCLILSTPNDTFMTAKKIHQSVPISYVMTKENLVYFTIHDFLEDVRDKMLKSRFRSYPVVDEDQNFIGMVSRYHLISRKRKEVVLLDHNEKSQSADGIDDARILEIIDHHRLGDIQTTSPILMKNVPVGSTATIIAEMFLEEEGLLTPSIAGLLMAAVISDTLKFVSPTSTQQDVDIAIKLAAIAEISIEEFALKMFNSGTQLKDKSMDEIINGDLKEYNLGKFKIGMAQVYSMKSESLTDIKDELIQRLEYSCGKNGYALLVLLVTDLYRNGSEVIFTGQRSDLVIKAFNLEPKSSSIFLPGILSRKKQVVPLIMSVADETF